MIGPNCLGFLKPSLNLNASFSPKTAKPGNVAFISQSGALGTAILDWANKNNVGFSYFVSVGSVIDVSFDDLIDYFGEDPNTSSILIYMETLTNARKFLSAARAFARTKPIIILKVGKSTQGAKAAMSHTGSLTGSDEVFDAAFKRAGILRVDTIGQLFDCAQTLSKQRRPRGNRLAIVTNAGGPGVIATDHLINGGGQIAKLSKETLTKLNEILSPNWSKSNPIDVLGDAGPEHYEGAVELAMKDENVDGILVILTPQTMTDSAMIAERIVALSKKYKKTILTSWMGESEVEAGRETLKKGNVPVYAIPENAVQSFLNMYQYGRNQELLYETPSSTPKEFTPNLSGNKELIKKIQDEKRTVLTPLETTELLTNYDIPLVKSAIASNITQVQKITSQINFPVVMKIVSPDILHKTDVGGIRLDIHSLEQAKNAYKEIMTNVKKNMPSAKVEGVLIQERVIPKYELFIGAKQDPIFGPVIAFGMGGVAVELFKDTSIGLPPLNMKLAHHLIEETKIYQLLKGYRNMKGVNIRAIEFLLYKFAYLIMDFPEIKEIDINPFTMDEERGVVLDAKVILHKDPLKKDSRPYSHLVISPYPKEYVKEVKLKNGKKVTLRPIKPEDEPLEEEMFKHFSKETQRFRFFTLIKDISHKMLIRYTQNDYDREIAIIAELTEQRKKKMAGVVRLIADAYNETAEFAIVMADPWQHLGLGNLLTDYILEIAKERKIKKIFGNVLPDNHAMLHIFKKRGFSISRQEDVYYAELNLTEEVCYV